MWLELHLCPGREWGSQAHGVSPHCWLQLSPWQAPRPSPDSWTKLGLAAAPGLPSGPAVSPLQRLSLFRSSSSSEKLKPTTSAEGAGRRLLVVIEAAVTIIVVIDALFPVGDFS